MALLLFWLKIVDSLSLLDRDKFSSSSALTAVSFQLALIPDYRAVLHSYIEQLLRKGLSVEFFLEGTRWVETAFVCCWRCFSDELFNERGHT